MHRMPIAGTDPVESGSASMPDTSTSSEYGGRPDATSESRKKIGLPDQVEERRGSESGPFSDDLSVAPPSAGPSILVVEVGWFADGVLYEAVALDPAVLVGPPELGLLI